MSRQSRFSLYVVAASLLLFGALAQVPKPGGAGGGGSVPVGAAGGDLTGTYPNPTIKASVALTTPNIGAATATTVNGLTITSTTGSLTLAAGKTATVNNSLTLAGTDGTTQTFPTTSGTVLTSVSVISNYMEFRAGNCQNVTANLASSIPAANAPAGGCLTGTNTNYGTADFDAATDESIQDHFTLPPLWTGNVDLVIYWHAAATSGDVVWAVQTACVATGESLDPSFNTASTVTQTAQGTANRANAATISAVTVTGCAADERLFFKFYRDAAAVGDTMTGDARLVSLRFTVRRTL